MSTPKQVDENLWSTAKVDELLKKYDKTGVIPMLNPFFQRKMNKKKAGLVWEYTMPELMNMAMFKNDILAFAGQCMVMTDKGLQKIKLRPYQIVALKKMQANNFFLYLASRQIGKSIIVAVFISWIVSFYPDQACLLGSENLGKAKDLKSKIDDVLHNLPFYLQNGIVYYSTQRTIFDNGSKVISEPTTENFGVSGSFNVVYIDEFALIEPDLQESIIKHVVPTLDSFSDARFIITTTPRGRNNKFYSLWEDALAGKNKFVTFMTKWFEVDGRDEAWKLGQIALIGVEGFNEEYDLSFSSDATLLFNTELQTFLQKSGIDFIPNDDMSKDILFNHVFPKSSSNIVYRTKRVIDPSIDENSILAPVKTEDTLYKNVILVKKGYDINNIADENRHFVISIDLSEGCGEDYQVANFMEIIPFTMDEIRRETIFVDETSFFKLEQVALIRSNLIGVEDFAKFLRVFINGSGNHANMRIILETNYDANLFMKTFFDETSGDDGIEIADMMVEFPNNMDKDSKTFKVGIKQSTKTKEAGVKSVKRHVESGRIIITERSTIVEAQGFGKNKKGLYSGTTKNDDSFVTVLNASHYFDNTYFEDQIEDLMKLIDEDTAEAISLKIDQESDGDDEDYGIFSGEDDEYSDETNEFYHN